MQYCGMYYGTVKYRGVKVSTYRSYPTKSTTLTSYTYQDDNGYYKNTTYWLKYEPLKWHVLDPAKGLVLSEYCVDSQAYSDMIYYDGSVYRNNSGAYVNDYVISSIRKWLNDSFINLAFLNSEKSKIQYRTLDDSSQYNLSYNSASTTDRVFLLLYNEAKYFNYGFNSSASNNDAARRAHSSDYAKCQGAYTNSSYKTANGEDASYWWLRSPGYSNYNACLVRYVGDAYILSSVDLMNIGVRPALTLNL